MLRAAIVSIGLAASSAAFMQADTLFSDFTPGGSFYLYGGPVVASNAIDYRPTIEFNSGTDNLLDEVDFVTSIGNANTDTNQVTVTLSQDTAGAPGAIVASQEFDGDMGILGSTSSVLTWTPAAAITPNTVYFITLDGPNPGDVTWNYNLEGQYGYLEFENGAWTYTQNTLGAINVIGEFVPAPEPGTLGMLACAAAAAGLLRRRLK